MTRPAAELVIGRVMHRRKFPVSYRFDYPVFSLLLDIDQLRKAEDSTVLFSWNRWNVLSFRDRDHGPRDGSPLRPWAEQVLARHGIHLNGGRIRLSCFPRVFNYVFNPLSVWFCEDAHGSLRAVICQVQNTFREQHCYLLHNHGAALEWPVRQTRAKRFHVSPFIGMQAWYAFRIARPGRSLAICIHEFQDGEKMLAATQTGATRAFTTRNILTALVRTPVMTFKVITMIHWHALRLWLAGAPFYRKPPPPEQEVTP